MRQVLWWLILPIFASTVGWFMLFIIGFDIADQKVLLKHAIEQRSLPVVFSAQELRENDGKRKDDIFIAIVGRVYNVTNGGKSFYGPDSPYAFFAGQDSSRSYVTGSATVDGDASEILQLTNKELLSVAKWVQFYDDHANYTFAGFVHGKYFDQYGFPRPDYKTFRRRVEKEKEDAVAQAKKHPRCNFLSKHGSQKQLWCEDASHFPTRFSGSQRCYCVSASDIEKRQDVVPYEDCKMQNKICYVLPSEEGVSAP